MPTTIAIPAKNTRCLPALTAACVLLFCLPLCAYGKHIDVIEIDGPITPV